MRTTVVGVKVVIESRGIVLSLSALINPTTT
jgi:hypothetical protein